MADQSVAQLVNQTSCSRPLKLLMTPAVESVVIPPPGPNLAISQVVPGSVISAG